MEADIKNINYTTPEAGVMPLSVNKWRFITWMFIISSIMIIASLTSAYIVKRAEGAWNEFEIPQIFWFSTVVLLFSSIFMHLALFAAKKNNQKRLKTYILITFVLGITFAVLQVLGWAELRKQGIYLAGNVSGSFFYVFTYTHIAHLVGGIGLIIATTIFAFQNKINSNNILLIENTTTYWHFVDFLWIYLFAFLLYLR